MRYPDIAITLGHRPVLSLTPPCVTLIAETRCEACGDRLAVTAVERESDIRADPRYAAHLRCEVIESLLQVLWEHDQENHGNSHDQ